MKDKEKDIVDAITMGLGIFGAIMVFIVPLVLLLSIGALVFWGIGCFICWAFGINFVWTFWHGLVISIILLLIRYLFIGGKE